MTNYVQALRKKSEAGQRIKAKALRLEIKKQHGVDLAEAVERIEEAETLGGSIDRATQRGKTEAVVCVLRGDTHFRQEFRLKQSPKFLGTIGNSIRKHFMSKGLKVSFKLWEDGMRIRELPSDSGYELIVSW